MSRQTTLLNPTGTGQTVAIGVASAATTNTIGDAGPNMDIQGVLCTPTVDCFIEVNEAPTAVVNTSTFVPAFHEFPIQAKWNDKVAVIRLSGDGTLYTRPLL